jgi:RNA polymerase sigma-70 factor (ECF subfamily)
VTEQQLLAEQFESHRGHLRGIAYRMLGSTSEAEDAVQEAWIRLSRSDTAAVANLRAWLNVVVSRVCLDMLRARRARREDPVDTVEPVVLADPDDNPAAQAELADSVGLALLVVLDTLAPAERLAFVLHDMFGVAFDEIATIVDRSPGAAKQLASRARRRVRGAAPPVDPDLARQREVVAAFLAAAQAGDFEALLKVLDPHVVFRIHAAPGDPRARPAAVGAEAVAGQVLAQGAPFAPLAEPALVNGGAGLMVRRGGRLLGAMGCTVSEGRITSMDLVIDPDRLPEPG